jgi:hypothetical protein
VSKQVQVHGQVQKAEEEEKEWKGIQIQDGVADDADAAVPSSSQPTAPPSSSVPSSPMRTEATSAGPARTGADEGTAPASVPSRVEEENSDATPQPMWFERPETSRYWVQRGREACAKLGIEVRVGIER